MTSHFRSRSGNQLQTKVLWAMQFQETKRDVVVFLEELKWIIHQQEHPPQFQYLYTNSLVYNKV